MTVSTRTKMSQTFWNLMRPQNNSNMNNKTSNSTVETAENQSKRLIKYITPEKVWIGLPFIDTTYNILMLGMAYLKTENWLADSKTEAVRLLDVWETDGILNIKVQNLTTFKVQTLIWNLRYSGTDGKWMWSITDMFTITELNK
jgi:hypothetical protein